MGISILNRGSHILVETTVNGVKLAELAPKGVVRVSRKGDDIRIVFPADGSGMATTAYIANVASTDYPSAASADALYLKILNMVSQGEGADIMDDSSDTVTYQGYTTDGTNYHILKVDMSDSANISQTWAYGEWTDRATLTYA